jgi:hypothetical protein
VTEPIAPKDDGLRLPSPIRRVSRGYGPLIATVVFFAVVTTFVPTVARREIAGAGGTNVDGGTITSGSEGEAGQGGAGDSAATAGPGGTGRSGVAPARTSACGDRPAQVPGDTYSPPCIAFTGDNGGTTSRGVTADKVHVSVRVSDVSDFQALFEQIAGSQISETPQDIERTLDGLVDYFNKRFQFYGRKITLDYFDGQGSPANEILGGGQEQATADAVHAGRDLGAFADITAITPPYADALVREKVVALGAPYMSREWYSSRRPYAWSFTTDCSTGVETVAGYHNRRMVGTTAKYAAGNLQGRPRRFATVSPENQWYQECVASGKKVVEAAGNRYDVALTYALDINRMSQQAASLVSRLKSENVTTIYCACDPLILVFLTSKATEQDYFPEWFIGAALVDTDTVGQLMDKEQWKHTWGISFLGPPSPVQGTYGYNAYKSVRKDEPSVTVDLLYYQLYMLSIGLQMAGPALTPESFERGMFAYPGGNGMGGNWKFGPRDYTTTDDAREIWWDPQGVSVQNGKPGTWIDTTPGKRFTGGTWPSGEPRVFTK